LRRGVEIGTLTMPTRIRLLRVSGQAATRAA
jgi:hypothetical protein